MIQTVSQRSILVQMVLCLCVCACFSCFIPNLLTFLTDSVLFCCLFFFRFNTVSLSFYRYKQYWRRESSLIQFSKWNLMIYMIRHVNIVWMLAVYWSYNGFVILYDAIRLWAATVSSHRCEKNRQFSVRKYDGYQYIRTVICFECVRTKDTMIRIGIHTNSIAHTTHNIALSTHNQPNSNCSRTTTTDFPSFTCYTHVHRASVNGEQFILVYGIYPSWTSTNCSEARLNYTQIDRELYQLSFVFTSMEIFEIEKKN